MDVWSKLSITRPRLLSPKALQGEAAAASSVHRQQYDPAAATSLVYRLSAASNFQNHASRIASEMAPAAAVGTDRWTDRWNAVTQRLER
jgi:hypothetical protein